jgi:hypothetical protein
MVMENDFNKLLNVFRKHFNYTDNFDLDDYLHCFGKGSYALLYTILFFPELVEIESSVFLKRNISNSEEIKKN